MVKPYKYTNAELRQINKQYLTLYDGIEFEKTITVGEVWGKPVKAFRWWRVSNPFSIAEYKADYDMSLDAVRGKIGSTLNFSNTINWMRRWLNGER